MKISNIKVDVKEKDLFDIITEVIEDHIQIKELKILSLLIQDSIYVEGALLHKINIKFSIKLSVDKLVDNTLFLNIEKIKCMNIKIGKFILKGIFKFFLNKYKEIGISMEDGKLVLDLNRLMPLIPYVNFKLESLQLLQGIVSTEVSDMVYDMNKKTKDINEMLNGGKESIEEEDEELVKETIEDLKEEAEEIPTEEREQAQFIQTQEPVKKTKDAYSDLREHAEGFIDNKVQGASKFVLFLPDLISLVVRLFKDKRVSKKDKIIAGIMLTYVAVPTDIIPKEVPVLGKIDDIIILFIGLDYLLNSVDSRVIKENWEGREDIILLVKQGVGYASEISAGGKIKKFINVLASF